MNRTTRISTLLVATLLMATDAVFLSPPALSETSWGLEVEQEQEEQEESIVDDLHEQAGEALIDTAEWFDSFFDDDRYQAELNKSRAKLKLALKYDDEDGSYSLSPRVNWRIHLPKLSKYTNIILFYSEDDDDDFGDDYSQFTNSYETDRDDFGVAIKQFLKMGERYNISATAGGSTSYLYAGLRWRGYRDWGKWQARMVERIRYYTDDGWENRLSLDMERPFSERWLFRTTGTIYWYESKDGFPYDLSFNMYQVFSPRRAIAYEWLNQFETKPEHDLYNLQLQLRYRQQFYRNWLLYEIKPRVNFRSENDHDPEYSIYLTLEAKFGREDRKKLMNVLHF